MDEAKLGELLKDISTDSEGLQALFDSLRPPEPKAGQTDPDDIPAPPETPVTQPGDLWILGDHRLLCGDSAKPEDVDRLLEGRLVHLVNTDPPYNVRVEPRSNNAIAAGLSSFTSTHHQGLDLARHPQKSQPTGQMRAKDRPLVNDFLPEEDFARLLRAWFGNLARALIPGGSFYVWGGYSNLGAFPPALRDCGLYFSQAIIWNKLHPVLTRKDFLGYVPGHISHVLCLRPLCGRRAVPPREICPLATLRIRGMRARPGERRRFASQPHPAMPPFASQTRRRSGPPPSASR
jgi:hypothetical protein